jgi:predicted permease
LHHLRDAIRSLRSTPVVTLVAVCSLALGIGANSAIFSIVDSLIFKALPVSDPASLARIGSVRGDRIPFTNPLWEAIRSRQYLFDGAFAASSTRLNLSRGETEMVDGVMASARYFDVLGVTPILGRTFTEADDRRGGGPYGPVAVISYGFWQRRFDGAADVIGRSLTVNRVPFTIVGVTPPQFFGIDVGRTFDIVVPIGTEPLMRGKESALDRRTNWWLDVVVRLKPGQSFEEAQTAFRGVQPLIRNETMPQDWRPEDQATYLDTPMAMVPAASGISNMRDRYRRPLLTIMVVVGLVLLIACANIANLLLARATARRHELSVRVALGASRWRIARQLLVESLVLSAAGAALGLVVAQVGSRLLVRQLSTSTNTVFLSLPLDWRIVGFTAMVAVGTALLFGVVPALRGTRVDPQDALTAQGRGVLGESHTSLGSTLVVLQVALSLVLVFAAGLFMRTFTSLATLDLGFDRNPVLIASINATALQLEPNERPALFRRALDATLATPGVSSAAVSSVTPIGGSTSNRRIELPDGPDLPVQERLTFINLVSENWFETYGVRFLAGRDFTAADRSGPPVVVVNETFARKFIPGRNPIGARIRQQGVGSVPTVEHEVVGYVKDTVYRSLREPVPPTMFILMDQVPEPPSSMSVSVKSAAGSPLLLSRPLAAALTAVHGDLAITLRPLADQVNAALIQERVLAGLSAVFGGLALLLAGLGLYGVTSYAVSRRRTEMGIRMALGSAPGSVVALILRRVAVLVAIGALTGVAMSIWAARFVSTLLFGVEPRDPSTLIGAVAVLSLIGLSAGWLPARRASQVDPARVLHNG